jgi:acetoin utilization protein AcuB
MPIKHTVDQFMTRAPYTVGSDQAMSVAHRLMRTHDLRHLPVLTEGRLVGLVSERDLAIVEALRRLDLDKATVDKAMVREPYCVSPGASLVAVARAMAACRHGAAVVVDDGNVVGIFTTVDALLALACVLGEGEPSRSRRAAG